MRPRICQFCGGDIPHNVNKCVHCGRYFDGTVVNDTLPSDATHLICIVDRSGSMNKIKDSAIEGFNTFLKEQQALPGTSYLTLVLFDDQYEVPIKNMDIQDVVPLTDRTFVPRGWTALYDAIGKAINTYKDATENTLCIILTDGEENSSKEYTNGQINDLINERRDAGWEFMYLAANQDAFQVASGMGIAFAANFAPTSKGVHAAYNTSTRVATQYRATGSVDASVLSGSDPDL